jgi:hypothetical protein
VTFRTFEKNVALWEYVSDIPKAKRGIKLLHALSGTARVAVEEMEFDELACEDGVRNVMKRLKDFYMPHLEVSLPRAFESAVYGNPRGSKESFAEFIARMERAFVRLEKEGVKLPEGAQGYILYRQSSLTESQDQRLLVWSDGKYDKVSIVKSLRKLDKVIKDSKGRGSYLEEVSQVPEESYPIEYDLGDDDDDPDFVFVAEGDLDQIIEESDVHEALAAYQDVRRALKEQRSGRGFFGGGKGKGSGVFGKSSGKGKMQKVHLEQIKLRTRCHRCKAIGHWARECKNEERPWSSVSGSQQSNQSTSAKSGFLVVSGEGQVRPQEQFWLKQFVEGRKAERLAAASDSAAYKERERVSFNGIVTESHDGVVDTAAEGGLVGSHALDRLLQHLRQAHGLQGKWIPKTSAAKGVGGQAKVLGVILLPLGIGGINGVLEATVVEGEVPLLLPVRLMRALHASINFLDNTFKIPEHNINIEMHELPSGHVTIPVTTFENNRFQMPPNTPGCLPEDFHVPRCGEHHLLTTEAMGTSQSFSPNSFSEKGSLARHQFCDGESSSKNEESRIQSRSGARSEPGGPGVGSTTKESPEALEDASRQDLHSAGLQRTPRSGRRMVSAIAALACLAGGVRTGDPPGCLCYAHTRSQSVDALERKESPDGSSQQLHPPYGSSEGRGQLLSLLCDVPRLPHQVGDSRQGVLPEEGTEGGKERGSLEASTQDQAQSGESGRGARPSDARGVSPRSLGRGSLVETGAGEAERSQSRELQEAGSYVDEPHEAPGGAAEAVRKEPGGGQQEHEEQHPTNRGEVQMRGHGRAPEGQEGRREEGANILQVHAEEVRFLPVGLGGSPCKLEPTVLELEHSSLFTKPSAEESQEPGGWKSHGIPQIQEPEDEQGRHGREGRLSDLHSQQSGSPPLKEEESWIEARVQRQRKVLRRAQRNKRHGGTKGYLEADLGYEVWKEDSQEW